MAAPLGFKTFNTGDVLSAADTNGYLMQGIWVFADATARDAAVTSPQEGNSCYLKDTDVIQVYSGSSWVVKSGGSSPLTTKGDLYTYSTTDTRLPVGTNGHTLVADSSTATGLVWQAPASGGGMTVLASGSLSGSSLSLTSISGSYNDLFLVLRDATFTQNSEVQVRINNNSGSVYDQLGLNVTTSTFVGYGSQNATISGVTYYATSSQGNYVLSSRFIDYAKTTTRKQIQHQASYTRHDNAGQETTVKFDTVRDSNAITRVDVILTNASFTGGTYILYGVK